MKFNRVIDNKLQIIISKEDMQQRDIRKWDLVPHNPEAQKLFQEILEEAREACGFDVGQNAQLMIEAYPMTGESMLITVTKIHSGPDFPLDLGLEGLGQALMDELMQEDDIPEIVSEEIIVRFAQMEDAIQASAFLQGHYDGASQLLRYEGNYYLALLEKEWLTDGGAAALLEFGDEVSVSLEFFREHGQVIIAEDALEILSEL